MLKRIISIFLCLALLVSFVPSTIASALIQDEDEIPTRIGEVQSVYVPGKTYFVSNSIAVRVGYDDMNGNKELPCFAPGTTNSHGRFGGLWQSMGFAKYVFYNVFGEIPGISYHCNKGELNDKVEVIGRYATHCDYIRGDIDGNVTVENVKELIFKAKQGDIIVVAPKNRCNAKGQAMIYMGSNEAAINVYQADWLGKCEISENVITFDALAMYHCITLLRSTNYPYPEPVPPAAVEKVTLSGNDFSLNESVTVTWPIVKKAEKYKAYLVDMADKVVAESESKSSVTSFVFQNPGEYRIKVVANNEYGDSAGTYSEKIVVHNQNIVTFKDYDGTVITTQKVEYGKDATAPNVPQRKGYQFAGWDKSLRNIQKPTDITATYEVEKYTIKYYDVGKGKELWTETVEYQGEANPPTNYTIDEGYVFAGWQIGFDSQGTDYNCVDGDMTLIATQKWENPNLPITIAVSEPYRLENGKEYTATLNIKNNDSAERKNVKILGTLKAADGKALKIVVLRELSLAANESVTENIKIVYSEKATIMEFAAVGMVGNSKTGGLFSKTVSANILDNTSWGEWTDWTAEDKRSSYDAYETKTQYRYRNKMYTTAKSSSLSGWTKYNKTSSTGSWSGWSNSYVSAFSNDSQNREVKTQVIPATYQTRWKYNRSTAYYDGLYWSTYALGYYATNQYIDLEYRLSVMGYIDGRPHYGSYAGQYGTYLQNYWWNESSYQKQLTDAYTQYSYRDTYYMYYFWKWGDWSSWSDTYKSGDETDTRTMYRYRNRDDSDASEDTSNESHKPTAEKPWEFSKTEVRTGEKFVMTLTMPKTLLVSGMGTRINFDNTAFEITAIENAPYADMQPNLSGCNKVGNIGFSYCDPTFDPNTTVEAGTVLLNVTFKAKEDATLGNKVFEVSEWNVIGLCNEETYTYEDITPEIGDKEKTITIINEEPSEEPSGESFDVSGVLNHVEEDFNGKIASVMVYKKCNTDPTEEQLEYVGQTTIGEGNTYSFKFEPREMPSIETGDFIIALGIEGADRLVNIDVIEADVPEYKVQFLADGVIIEDPNAQDVTDSDGNLSRAQIVKEGETAIAPEPPEKEGYTFVKWSETLTGIKSDKRITAEYELNEYSVVFVDWEIDKVTEQKYKYGEAIVYPALEPVEGANVRTWDKQIDGMEIVTGNMIISSVSEPNEYTVIFMSNNEVVSTQTVKHGQKAVVPEFVPTIEGMNFAGWIGICSTEFITQDTIFEPSFVYSKTVSVPEAELTKNSDGSSTVELSCDTEGAQIYYVINSCCESVNLMEEQSATEQPDSFRTVATPYTGEITLQENETITFVAYADGMNESIPVSESNENQNLYFDVDIESNTLREYRSSIEGDVSVSMLNNSPEYSMGLFTLCFYDQRGVLLDFTPVSVDIKPGDNEILFEDVCINNIDYDVSDEISCKLLVWLSGEDAVTPISDFVLVDVK